MIEGPNVFVFLAMSSRLPFFVHGTVVGCNFAITASFWSNFILKAVHVNEFLPMDSFSYGDNILKRASLSF